MTTQSVLDHHLDAFARQDLAAVMEDYTEDSVMVSQLGTFRGLSEIEGLYDGLFAEFSQPGSTFTMDEKIVEGDVAYIVWHAETPDNEYEFGTDTFYISADKIAFQTFAGKITPVE